MDSPLILGTFLSLLANTAIIDEIEVWIWQHCSYFVFIRINDLITQLDEIVTNRLTTSLNTKHKTPLKCQICVRTVDPDVVVLCISYFFDQKMLGLKELWINYGVGNHKKCLPAHYLAEQLGEDKAVALREFHAFTGCDTIIFCHKRKKISLGDLGSLSRGQKSI